MKHIVGHFPDEGCHEVGEKPEEQKLVLIHTNEPNSEFIVGFYSQGKWFYYDNKEINEASIVCWHVKEDDI